MFLDTTMMVISWYFFRHHGHKSVSYGSLFPPQNEK